MHIWIVFLQTALHWAAKKGREDIAELLINTGMDVNMKSVGIKFVYV